MPRMFANSEKKPPEKLASLWRARIDAANKYFEDWEKRFKCKTLDEYYEGKQWKENDRYEPYVINLFFSSIEVKQPSLAFQQPIFHITPRPQKSDWNPNLAFSTCEMLENTLNSFITNKNLQFGEEVDLALLDHWFYFSIVEIGYSAEWIDNPNAGKPILKADYDADAVLSDGEVLREPEQIPEKEWIYVKRIPAHRFRVGGFDSSFTHRTNWVGYYEFVRTADLLSAGVDENKLEFAGARSNEFIFDKDENQISQTGDLTKVWKIWDLRAKERIIVKDSPATVLFTPSKFSRLPLIDFRPIKRRKGWYPQPVTFNWKLPQDEVNEAHEMNRAHRRKARSLYQAQEGLVESDEMDKMITAPDMSILTVKKENAIQPIMNPTQDSSLGISLQVSKDDFNIVSATTSDLRGENDRTTATQAQITATRSASRETAAREKVADFLCRMGKEVLLQVREKFTLPFWIKVNLDSPADQTEIENLEQQYKLVTVNDLGDDDFDVNVSVESLSPVANEEEKKKLFEFMMVLQQFPLLATQPDLIREVAFRIGYKNMRVINQFIKVAELNALMQAGAAGANAGGGANPAQSGAAQASQNAMANATPPSMEQVRNGIMGQIQ